MLIGLVILSLTLEELEIDDIGGEVNPNLVRYKQMVREKLHSEKGLLCRSQRPADVEAVFGIIKHKHKFKRFNFRGFEKTEIEAGLISLSHNLRKMAN